jgi:hypothetical protein
MILLCIGCAIFGVTEVPTDGIHFDSATNTESDFNYMNAAETGTANPIHNATINPIPTVPTSMASNNNTPIIIPQPPGTSNTTSNTGLDNDFVRPITSAEAPNSFVSKPSDQNVINKQQGTNTISATTTTQPIEILSTEPTDTITTSVVEGGSESATQQEAFVKDQVSSNITEINELD